MHDFYKIIKAKIHKKFWLFFNFVFLFQLILLKKKELENCCLINKRKNE